MLALATVFLFGAAPPLGGESSSSGSRSSSIAPPRTTPAMAWNAWNTFSSNGVPLRGGRAEYQSVAEAMLASGMVAAGYTLVSTVCTGWTGRDPVTHKLQENLTAWPGGMASFADYLHGKGMQLSVYSDAGARNCCGEPGSLGHEALDTATFAAWGADAVGVDYCGGPADVEGAYRRFADGIVASGRAMQLEIWNLGRGDAQRWAPTLSRNMTAASAPLPSRGSFAPHIRLTGDIGNYWSGHTGNTESLLSTVDQIGAIADLWSYGMGNGSGTFPNYGQMIVGVPADHPTVGDAGLTLVEAQSHFSMWCMFPTILMATNDVRKRDPEIESILLNGEAIAINQDAWAAPAMAAAPGGGVVPAGCGGEAWVRPLANGDTAVLVLNRAAAPVRTRVDFGALLLPPPAADTAAGSAAAAAAAAAAAVQYAVRDVQAKADLGVACGHIDLHLASHQTAFLRLTPVPGSCTPPAPPAPCTGPAPTPAPTPPPPCPTPSAVPAGFAVHATRGYYDHPVGTNKGTGLSIDACAALCASDAAADGGGCSAFHVFFTPAVSCAVGTCYVHGAPLSTLTPNADAILYDKK